MTYYSNPPRPDELYHFGIKGMKWGVRRFQNRDGTLTPKGERRYQNADKAYHDVAKAIYKQRKKLKDDNFGEHSRRVLSSMYKSGNSKRKEQLSNRLVELQAQEEDIWYRNGSQKEKDSIRRKIETVQDQLSSTSSSVKQSKSQLTKAQLMDLGFNEQTADRLEKKTRRSNKAFRMYYL